MLSGPKRTRRRDESGAVAILFAFLTVALFTIAAMSVDLGNAIARRTDTQTQADFGAFAAAQHQTETAKSGMTISAAMKDAVALAMNNNQPQDDSGTCWTTKTCVAADELTDNDLLNGEIRYCAGAGCGTGYSATVKGLQVVAPRNKVDFGLANFIGVDSTTVNGRALINVFTAGKRVMPMFAVEGCDYGLQTLADPATGHTTPVVPATLFATLDTNQNNLVYNQVTSPFSPQPRNSSGTDVSSLTLNSTNNTVSIDASKWKDLAAIGFFRANGDAPIVQTSFGLAPSTSGLASGYTKNSGSRLALNVPDAVATFEEVWWIRARDTAGTWSPLGEALPMRVGDAVLECDAGSKAGNFGTLKFPRTDVPTGNEIPANIALGLQSPLTPEVHQWALANPPAALCTDGVNGAILSSGTNLRPGTNCVDTDTGLPANVATEGLVTGGTYGSGVLQTQNTRPGCNPKGQDNNRTLSITGNPSINDDVLTCYFTSGATSIAEVASDSYSGGPAFDVSILSAPRFFYVPVLRKDPTSGGSQTYSIIDFRAAFITDEAWSTAAVKGSKTGTSDNGIYVQGNDIKQIKVVFFNSKALPSEGDIPIIDYLGVGTRVIRLID